MKDSRHNISIVAIGDELLIGQVQDTNSSFIASIADKAGWTVSSISVVHDSPDAIEDAVRRAMETSSVVITTGGLGPTKDDMTKQVLASIFGGEMIFDKNVLDSVASVMVRRGLKLNDTTATQAIVPSSARIFVNEVGTAPIMWFDKDDRTLVSLPGVPFEMRHMFSKVVFPEICRKYGTETYLTHRTLLITGISESDLSELLADFEQNLPESFHLAYLPGNGYLRLRLDGSGVDAQWLDSEAARLLMKMKELCGIHVLYDQDVTPAWLLLRVLREHKLTFATAESCTGGNIAHLVTSIPGSSESMLGGVVSYSNSVKENTLGVPSSLISSYGAVSEPVAASMAEGVRKATGADVSVATSGIAGPGGAVEGKPVGTVCMAVSTAKSTDSYTFHFPGDRARVIERASDTALILAIRSLLANAPG